MFHLTGRAKKVEQNDRSSQFKHESAVKRVYTHNRTTLAIARMSYCDSYTFRRDVMGNRAKVPDHFAMYGIVDEPYDGAKRVHCEVHFTDQRPEDDFVGSCFLTHILEDEQKDSQKRKLKLEVSIWDSDGAWRQKSYGVLRDAAISGAQFCHFRIETEILNHTEALTLLRERGYGPTIKVREFTMWPTVVLPKAPDWGGERYDPIDRSRAENPNLPEGIPMNAAEVEPTASRLAISDFASR
jgi:hypothetical protein